MSKTLKQAARQALEALEHHVEQTRPIQRTTEAITALREALEAAPEPAAAGQEPVAHRVMRKTLDGKWVCDGRYWFDGPPSKELTEIICADKSRWRVDVAYTAPQPARQPPSALPDGDIVFFSDRGDAVSGYSAQRVLEILRANGIWG